MLENKIGIVFGVANKRSIAWASAQALAGAGAQLAFTYQNERLRENVEGLTRELSGDPLLVECDVQKPEQVAKTALEASTRYLAWDLGKDNIRVNAISAGPISTLAARGVGNLSTMLKHHADRAPLRRNVEAREVGNVALFLCSPLASAITGEVLHVDCGYNIMAF